MTTRKNVHPYYSVRAHRHGVYHDRADCPIGQQIHSEDLAAGTGGHPRCEQCRDLDNEGTSERS